MKKSLFALLLAFCLLPAFAADEAPAALAGRLVVLAGPGATLADAEAAAAFLKRNTSIDVAAAEGALSEGDWAIELFSDPEAALGETEGKRTTLNLAKLRFGEPTEETLARRTGQALCRSLASLFGEEPCVIPLCVLWRDKPSLHELDELPSGNYCPPCRARMERAARERHLAMQPDPRDAVADEVPAEEK